jgi:molecular chaperone IbpA
MRTVDLTPLYRAGVGFDRLANMVDNMLAADAAPSYPPYNITITGDADYRITIAVAGFGEADIEIETKEGELVIKGAKEAKPEADNVTVLHRGIAERAFERRFKLADHVRVTGAVMQSGLLHVDLVREVPEALRPRKITIETGTARPAEIAAE